VVVASHDGILVSDKMESSYLKPYADKITQRPMYEQRIWGEYRVLDYITDEEGNATLTKRLHIKKGMQISYQYHKIRTEIWTISKGEGILFIDDERKTVKRGDVIHILPQVKHAIQAVSDLEFIEVQIGSGELVEDDIVRLAVQW
ncbi:MAG: phosphomannose isomerase type II C-terminal cupin domain, partial [Oscillospiraceae bacterium]